MVRRMEPLALGGALALALLPPRPLMAQNQELRQSLRLAPVTWLGLGQKWDQAVHDALISRPEPMLWMIVKPSFSPEYSVELDQIGKAEDDLGKQCYAIRWRQAKVNIWFTSMRPVGRNKLAFRPPSHIKTTGKDADIPADAAQEIAKAWLHMLKEARYPSDSEFASGMDGTDYEFYAWDLSHREPMKGHIWSPESGPTAMLVELGENLIRYVKAKIADRPALLAKCVEEAKAIQAYQYK